MPMNGDELLTAFLKWVEEIRPERFYPPKFHYDPDDPDSFMRSRYVADYDWSITVATEACYGAYDAVLFRKHEGIIREVIPVEVKADTDKLDDRLRAQLWVHLRNFQRSMLILGKEQAYKITSSNLDKMLPTEIWAYTGEGFKQVSDQILKYVHRGAPEISHRAIEHAFGIKDVTIIRKLSKRLWKIRAIIDKLSANQWRFGHEEKFTEQEAEIAREIFGVQIISVYKKPKPRIDVASVGSTGFESKALQQVLTDSELKK